MEPFNGFNDISDRLRRMDEKLDAIDNKIASIDRTQVVIQKDLEYHIQRTDLLEDRQELFEQKLQPFESIRFTWQNIAKLVALLAGLSSIIALTIKMFEKF